jgi:hypothetical protein
MPEKKHRHRHHKHHHKHEHIEAASTDIADLGAAAGASRHQRDDEDEMGSPGVSNAVADIVAISDQSNPNGCEIVMNLGASSGVQLGQDGYVKDTGGGVLARFTVDKVNDESSRAWVDMPYSVVQYHLTAVIGPS